MDVIEWAGRRTKSLERPKLRSSRPTLGSFFAWALHYLPHYFPIAPSPFHAWISTTLERAAVERSARLNILAPRSAAKSTWASQAYPLYSLLEKQEPYVILTADTSSQAEKYLEAIREELEGNEALRADYPDACRRGDPWRQNAIRLGTGQLVESLGTGDKMRGRKNRQHRPTLIVVDDPQNTEHMISELQRTRSWDWLVKDVLNAGQPDTNVIVLGTALHRDCIVCKLQQAAGWRSHVWQAVQQWPARMDLWREWEDLLHDWDADDDTRQARARAYYDDHRAEMDRGARVLWPEREDLYRLMSIRASIGPSAFASERQNEPVDPSLCEWDPELFEWPGFWFNDWPDALDVKTIGVDSSKGKSDRKGDYSAIVLYGRQTSGREYAEADLARRPVERICADLIQHAKRFRPDGIFFETNSFQELILPPLRSMAKAEGVELPIYPGDNMVNKLVRIRRLGVPLGEKRMRFKARSPGTQLLVEQLRGFPNGTHDDGPDALECARRLAVELVNKDGVRRKK